MTGRVGLWLVGARGSVATTAVVGLAAVRHGLAAQTGLVCSLPELDADDLPGLDEVVVGGHDVADGSARKRAEQLAEGGVVPAALVTATADELDDYDARIRAGYGSRSVAVASGASRSAWQGGEGSDTGVVSGPTTTQPDARETSCSRPGIERDTPGYVAGQDGQREAVLALSADIRAFAIENGCDVVVVVNVSSTEPLCGPSAALDDLGALRSAWARGEAPLPPSSVYAAAAFEAGAAFVDFTPSTGARVPALEQLAAEQRVPFAGSDGKTGETLVKSVLAPMFVQRALRVRSWSGTNLLGGGDGATLADPQARASKTVSKARGLEQMTGYPVEGQVHIDNVADLGDWKTAWDHITFEGFLGVPMTLQFTWQGCDSALAAPLVLDLARLTALAVRRGGTGPQEQLGFFFKDPVTEGDGAAVHDLGTQFGRLATWVSGGAR